MSTLIKKSLHTKILFLVLGLISAGVVLSIYWELRTKENELLDEKLRASAFIAKPVLNSIYEDMLEERADMARKLVDSLSRLPEMNIHIVRSNGVEEAFRDLKTIREVEKEFGEIRPEWLSNHPDERENRAPGADSDEFKRAVEKFRSDWKSGPVHYVDRSGAAPTLTYLLPIEKKAKCNTCHAADGARGILVIRMPLDDMYALLSKARTNWIVSGVLALGLGGALLSLLIKRSITGPIRRNVEVIKRLTAGKDTITSERVDAASDDEIGYLSRAFNEMLDDLQRREEENARLFSLVTESKKEWEATFDAIQDLISIHDTENRILKVNRALAARFNVEPRDLVGKKCGEMLYCKGAGPAGCPHDTTVSCGRMASAEISDWVFPGTFRVTTFPIYNARGEVFGSVHIARDVSQEKLLREQLLHSEKLSSLGKLVAGIAHELNNPLMGIMGFSQILMDTPGDKKVEDIKERLRKIYHESLRTSKIVQNLLTFARTRRAEREYVCLNDVIRKTVDLREYSLKTNNISIRLDLAPDLPKTMADRYQLQQVFVNLINNAEDAMAARGGAGRLEITTALSGGRITAAFRDNGPGVPREIIHKVFDPFFTTKEVGKGTGLGLSISHGIITEHGGEIGIFAPEDGGTLVTVALPVLDKEAWVEVKRAMDEAASDGRPRAGKGARVLVVDDERSIRESLEAVLAAEGFAVDTALDGKEAVDLLASTRYGLLLTDVKMPGLNGIDIYRTVATKYPYLKDRVVMLTGDIFSDDVKDFLSSTKCPYLLKPFETRDLLNLIRRLG